MTNSILTMCWQFKLDKYQSSFFTARFANHNHPILLIGHCLYNRTLAPVTPTLPSGAVAPLESSSSLVPAQGQLCRTGLARRAWRLAVLACKVGMDSHGGGEKARATEATGSQQSAFWSKIAVLRGKIQKAQRMQIWVGWWVGTSQGMPRTKQNADTGVIKGVTLFTLTSQKWLSFIKQIKDASYFCSRL